MSALNLKHLEKVCLDFRRGILGRRSSHRMCNAICRPLQAWLSFSENLQTRTVQGLFVKHDGDPNIFRWAMWHWWLKLPDGRIIDPTADQLKRYEYPAMPKVFIGERPDWYPEEAIP